LPDFLEEGLLIGVGFGVTDGGDLLAGNAVGDRFGENVATGFELRNFWFDSDLSRTTLPDRR
jgi:hypothetical protein